MIGLFQIPGGWLGGVFVAAPVVEEVRRPGRVTVSAHRLSSVSQSVSLVSSASTSVSGIGSVTTSTE